MAENNLEEEVRNNKFEARSVLRKSIIGLLIYLVSGYLFVSTLNRSKIGENSEISINQISYIVIFFCVVVYSAILSFRNLLLGIRELIISKDKINYISIFITSLTIIGIITLIITKALALIDY